MQTRHFSHSPNFWRGLEYVEINSENETADGITLKLSVISRLPEEKVKSNEVSRSAPKQTRKVNPTI